MADLYADENLDPAVVAKVRSYGHDVLTALESGRANRGIPDDEVLAYATDLGRAVVTHNRRHFIRLHRRSGRHAGIVICTADRDDIRLASHIHDAVRLYADLTGRLIRVYRGP